MSKIYKNISILIVLLTGLRLSAQPAVQFEEHDLTTVLNPWLLSNNAAGLGLSTVKFHGITEIGYNSAKGDLHRAQEGNEQSGLNFYSERYDKLAKNWTSWGSFNFIMDREKNRAWSDVINTYNNNPYIFGSSVPGNYDRQLFDFHVKISSKSSGRIKYGLGIDYQVGDLSRLRDPRTRVYLADYAILPAVTFRLNEKHFVGLNLNARYQKEKMPNVSTVQDDPNLKYYTFFGMENADAVIGGFKGFQRQFVSAFYGGDVQYSFVSANSQFLVTGGVFTQKQEILENIKQSPGTFKALNYKASVVFNTSFSGLLFNLTAVANVKQAAANENIQELKSVNDTITGINSQTWVTLFTYKNQYINNTYDAKLRMDVRDINKDKNDFSWLGGIEVGVNGFENKYNLPFSSMRVNRMQTGIYGQYRLLKLNEHRLTLKGNIDYETSFDNLLQLRNEVTNIPATGASTYTIGTYDIATNVILPDFNFYKSNIFKFKLETKYSLPLNFKKVKMIGYIRAYYGQAMTYSLGLWSNGGVAIGIIP